MLCLAEIKGTTFQRARILERALRSGARFDSTSSPLGRTLLREMEAFVAFLAISLAYAFVSDSRQVLFKTSRIFTSTSSPAV